MPLTMTAIAFLVLGQMAQAGATALPADPRLAPVRADIEAIVSRTAAAGLPSEIIVSKVREGLAKGVDPQRIGAAAERLAQGLVEARSFVVARRGGAAASPELVRAVAEARLAGIDLAVAGPLLHQDRAPAASARAVEVLTDLSRRGYPAARASEVVADLLGRDPGAVARLPGTLEVLRQQQALTHAESVEQVAHGLRRDGSLQAAAARAAEAANGRAGGERPGNRGKGHGQGMGASGGPGAGFVPPGQLKKQTEAKTPPGQSNPGRGKPKK